MSKNFIYLLIIFVILLNFNSALAQTSSAQNEKLKTEALKLINSPEPFFKPFKFEQPSPEAIADLGFEQVYANVPVKFTMADGKKLTASHFKSDSKTTVILVHGVLSGSFTMNKSAGLIREAMNAEVLAIDLRGHGNSEGKPGDVDFIDQYAADLSEIVKKIRAEKPKGKIILAGHSMGGGIILRYAMRKDFSTVEGYLLFAPLLGQDAPTIPQADATKRSDEEPFLKIHIQRIIGLKMLNSVNDHRYDNLPVLFFNLPLESPIKSYSYRANESMSPASYKDGLKAVDKPLIVLVGSKDEAFVASAFEKAIKENGLGDVFVLNGISHNGIRQNPEAMKLIKKWSEKNF